MVLHNGTGKIRGVILTLRLREAQNVWKLCLLAFLQSYFFWRQSGLICTIDYFLLESPVSRMPLYVGLSFNKGKAPTVKNGLR